MARIYPLFSSSKGNSHFIGTPSAGVLIDAGVSFKRLNNALAANNIDINSVKAVFITHPHSDHINGLKTLTTRTGIPVLGQRETLCEILEKGMISPDSDIFEMDIPATYADMEIKCFDTPHDTTRSCGYHIKFEDGRTCAVCTDLGHITETVDENITGCDLVLLESNYDPEMLCNGGYPDFLKERIMSDYGHLSNQCCGEQIRKLILNGTTRVILGHLSQDNNTPAIAEKTVLKCLTDFKRDSDYILSVASVETNGEMVVF